MVQKIEVLMISFLFITGSSIVAILGSLAIIIYQLSMLRKNIVNPDFNGKWCAFIKSWFLK